jgi:holo-[acyl-carrier protein] synthase
MAIVGLGLDLARISRFQAFLAAEKTALLERLFTVGERANALPKKGAAAHLAARFAAKEAFLKALGTGLRDGLSWHDMEVVHDPLGKPSLQLSGQAAAQVQARAIAAVHLSYSHDGDYAVATVILEGA